MIERKEFEDQKRYEAGALKRAGYKFIRIELLRRSFFRISAVELIKVVVKTNDTTGAKEERFFKQIGKMEFVPHPDYANLICDVADTKFNRRFLASNCTAGIFEIIDPEIKKQIESLASEIAGKVVVIKSRPTPSPEELPDVIDNDNELPRINPDADEPVSGKAILPMTPDEKVVEKKKPKQRGAITLEDD